MRWGSDCQRLSSDASCDSGRSRRGTGRMKGNRGQGRTSSSGSGGRRSSMWRSDRRQRRNRTGAREDCRRICAVCSRRRMQGETAACGRGRRMDGFGLHGIGIRGKCRRDSGADGHSQLKLDASLHRRSLCARGRSCLQDRRMRRCGGPLSS
jgi:hypothetical protein